MEETNKHDDALAELVSTDRKAKKTLVGLRLPTEQLDAIRLQAIKTSYETGRSVPWQSLVRQAISKSFPLSTTTDALATVLVKQGASNATN